MKLSAESLSIFGGKLAWNSSDWTSSDDRVRGGRSISHLGTSPPYDVARFYGHLDIKTLGGAGFASQRTVGEDRTWNLEGYDGIQIEVVNNADTDDKKYTFNIKNQLLPRDPDTGREQSTISYEFDFDFTDSSVGRNQTIALFIPWNEFRATYRGREDRNAPKIDLKNIKRFGIMIRSFFGGQEGDFSLLLKSIAAVKVKHKDRPSTDSGSDYAHERSQVVEISDSDSKRQVEILTARPAGDSKCMSPPDRDLEKQEEALHSGDVSSGDKKTPGGQTPSDARATPSTYKVLYVVSALMLALWVLHPGNCK
ncbi:complex I intermediate-associated protein 30-domain-containing protein [Phyllosticta citrichinensis]|uniref:Complex I intermediate-associated protein 30-domain-containing protein n=1 Tax=Phyllosticta citrichinensis TaxID=1130410 RepID=A0ABR1XU31_9PEZI